MFVECNGVLNTVKSQTCTCHADNKYHTAHKVFEVVIFQLMVPNNLHLLTEVIRKEFPCFSFAALSSCSARSSSLS